METRNRQILFWTLVCFFTVTAFLIIPYAIGYRFSFERGIFIYTGSITIKANPQSVAIMIDGQEVASKQTNRLNNSYHIGGIHPGEHFITVTAPDFTQWSKKVSINSGLSTEFWNVLLTRTDYPRTVYPTDRISTFFYDTQKQEAAYVQTKESGFRVGVYTLGSNPASSIVFNTNDYQFPTDDRENIEWSPKERKIIIPAVANNERNYFMVDVDTKDTLDLKKLSQLTSMENARWDSANRNYVYFISNNNLIRLNITDPTDQKTVAENVASYDLSSGQVYYFQLPSGIVYKRDPTSSNDPIQVTTAPPNQMSNADYQITVYDDKRIVFLNTSGDLYLNNIGDRGEYFPHLSGNARGTQFSDDGKKLLFWSDWEISTYFLRDWEVQPFRSENETRDVTRFADSISNVQWSKDYEHVVFSTGNKIKIVELDYRDQRNLHDIITLTANRTKAVTDFPNELLYFTDQDQEATNLYSIPFPEKSGLFQ